MPEVDSKNLKPEAVWRYFFELTTHPRCSGNEKNVVQYVTDVAKSFSLQVIQDEHNNVVIRKPASKGRKHHSPVVLQSHLDMVCEKNENKIFNFSKDSIPILKKGSWVTAEGTSLGADNGIGVATALAVLESSTISHPHIEVLLTSREEIGLVGARNLKIDFVQGRTLLNLDSEEEGVVFIGCAGGIDTIGTINVFVEKTNCSSFPFKVVVSGLRGGHSGIEIHQGRGNAIKILARVLDELVHLPGTRIGSIRGGTKRNAIPRESEAIVYLTKDQRKIVERTITNMHRQLSLEHKSTDPELTIEITELKNPPTDWMFTRAFQEKVISLLLAMPHGVLAMSRDIEGLVETSTNLAVVGSDEDFLSIQTSQRSSIESAKQYAARRVEELMKLAGAETGFENSYPGWTPNVESKILATCRRVYKNLTGNEIEVKAVHAGLECGIIGEKYEDMDMISFGPLIENVHSPDERVSIPSVEHFWDYLIELLKAVR